MTKYLAVPVAAAALLFATAARAGAPPRKTHELVEKGKASYETNCAACHGPQGEGDGAAAAALEPKPKNLATPPLAPTRVYDTLAKGIPGTAMVAFTHLPEDERWALSYYVADLKRGGHEKHGKHE
jgi:mono/diheme cytochrome c family protein